MAADNVDIEGCPLLHFPRELVPCSMGQTRVTKSWPGFVLGMAPHQVELSVQWVALAPGSSGGL
jgi:hypothetical protein